jgi:hypothetical protein
MSNVSPHGKVIGRAVIINADVSMNRMRKCKSRWGLQKLAILLLGGVLARPAHAQQTAATQPAISATPQDLAKDVHNPFEDFVKVQLEWTTGFSIGPHHNAGESVNLQPLIPFSLNPEWVLIARPSLSVTYHPSPHEQFGLNDLQTSFFLSPRSANEWIWGIGPIFQLPTATNDQLGTGRWSVGPTAALIYSNGPWFDGVLTYHLTSFAGARARGSVNQTYVEPQVSYNFESGWYVDTDPPMTFDWTADEANGWTIPAGVDVGKAFNVKSNGMAFQVGAYDLVKRPAGAPQWIIRVQLTALLPTGW